MLEFCFFPLTWNMDPLATGFSDRNRAESIATCVSPRVRVVEPQVVSAAVPCRSTNSMELTLLMQRWEQSSGYEPTRIRSQQDELRRTIHRDFNEHAAAAAVQLVGPITAEQLMEMFDWTIVARTSENVTVEGIPRDDSDRLFYRSIRVSLSADGAPDQIAILGRNQKSQTVWKADALIRGDEIRQVHFEDDAPSVRKTVVRASDTRFD